MRSAICSASSSPPPPWPCVMIVTPLRNRRGSSCSKFRITAKHGTNGVPRGSSRRCPFSLASRPRAEPVDRERGGGGHGKPVAELRIGVKREQAHGGVGEVAG